MRRIFFSLLLFVVSFVEANAVSKVIVLQGEAGLAGTYEWQPNYAAFPSVTFEVNSTLAASAFPGTSYHAQNVTTILTSGNASGLVGTIVMVQASTYLGRVTSTNTAGLNSSRTLPAAVPWWELENHSWGEHDPLAEDDYVDGGGNFIRGILGRFTDRIEQYNILAFICPPDVGQYHYRIFDAAPASPNMIKVGTTTSGMELWSENTPDVYEPVTFTSYACPTAAQTGIAMISWCKDNAPAYRASDLKTILINACTIDGSGRRIVNHTATMAALQAFYTVTGHPVSRLRWRLNRRLAQHS